MRRVRNLAEQTPASRERFADLLRAVSITLVVLGHWLVTVIRYDDGTLVGRSALPYLPWAHPLTWLVQVMPVFFLVGGFANAASLASQRQRGGGAIDWLGRRSARLVRPTTILMITLGVAALCARLLGAEPERARMVVWFSSIPLWFLTAYLAVVLLAPVMYALHERLGLVVPLVLVGLVALGDVARLTGSPQLAVGSYLFAWLAVHQMGFFWRDERAGVAQGNRGARRRRLPTGPRTGVPLLLAGLAGLLLATTLGPYPVSMINVSGERLHNLSPPSMALLALATAQLGLILLLRDPATRWLHRPRPWRAVVGVNAVILTTFLWHISAQVLLIGALHALGVLPTPKVGSADWLLWRLPWLAMSAMVLAVLVAVFARFETRGGGRHRERPARGLAGALHRPAPRAVLTAAGFTAVVVGLLGNSTAPPRGEYLFGMPTEALVAYLLGAAVLRVVR